MDTHFFFVTRMFSGLFESIQREKWNPTGIPAIVNLIEKLAAQNNLTWIVSCKTVKESSLVGHKYRKLTLNNIDIHVIPFKPVFKSYKIDQLINNLITFFYCLRLYRVGKEKLFYFDRSDIVIAALVKLLLRCPVVIRILGVYPSQKQIVTHLLTKIRNPLTFFAYKTRYDLAVCTQDGSGTEYYVNNLLNAKTKKEILLNGVDKLTPSEHCFTREKILLLFVGKLIGDKGILELLEAVAALKKTNPNFELRIVGKGKLQKSVEHMITQKGLKEHVFMSGSVGQSQIHRFYAEASVYISINKLGNLSNTVLEAMAAGKCIIMLGKDEKTHSDEYTEAFIPDDTVIRIDRQRIVEDLADRLTDLCENPGMILQYAKRMKVFAEKNLWTWDERIEHEMTLLGQVCQGGVTLCAGSGAEGAAQNAKRY